MMMMMMRCPNKQQSIKFYFCTVHCCFLVQRRVCKVVGFDYLDRPSNTNFSLYVLLIELP